MARHFGDLTHAQWEKGRFLCVGLDPDLGKIPEAALRNSRAETILAFNTAIIEATMDIAASFKPNAAFYEALGEEGAHALRETVRFINEHAPETPVILDSKRADIGNTNAGYVMSAFEDLGCDAVTVHPYLGSEALAPFFERTEKGVIVLCRTSNPGAGELQDLDVGGEPLYLALAKRVAQKWNSNGNCWLVVGATYPHEAEAIRTVAPDLPFLIPGVGAQGGDVTAAVHASKNSNGNGFLVSASRSIMYASSGTDFADAARREALALDSAIKNAVYNNAI
jgi:orotidine-5'-phosphate decarboxylase